MASIQPNHYNLSDRRLKISYSTSGIQGQPSLSYQDGHQTLNFHGDQVRTVDTEIGTLVSVTIHVTVDVGSTTFTVLIPSINLAKAGAQERFETAGIKTAHKTPLVQPPTGPRETYEVHQLKGTAQVVEFLAQSGGGTAGT
jgi:hypothetical protein